MEQCLSKMEQWYYTDRWNRQYGPVADSVLLQANAAGTIHAGTPVWKAGLAQWVAFQTVAPEIFEKDADGNSPELGVCTHTGRVCLRREMIPYGTALIGVEARQDFVQSLMETGRAMISDPLGKAGKYVGFWWRFLAVLLDEMIKYTVMGGLAVILIMVAAFFSVSFQMNSESDMVVGLLVFGLMIAVFGSGAIYEIWMVGKFQGTLGKMAIGAIVVQADDTRVSYKRALARWMAKVPIFLEGVKWIPYFSFVLMIGLAAGSVKANNTAMIIASFFLAFALPLIVTAIFSSAFWMAGLDEEKRALHDRIVSTRVIFKQKSK